jgi:hypothetical protein
VGWPVFEAGVAPSNRLFPLPLSAVSSRRRFLMQTNTGNKAKDEAADSSSKEAVRIARNETGSKVRDDVDDYSSQKEIQTETVVGSLVIIRKGGKRDQVRGESSNHHEHMPQTNQNGPWLETDLPNRREPPYIGNLEAFVGSQVPVAPGTAAA